jgi:hypothetical protein
VELRPERELAERELAEAVELRPEQAVAERELAEAAEQFIARTTKPS